eukprot:Skav221881  [mRNA]  locus=scaffold1395:391337:391942:+ [translate_table: standard]
MPFFCRRLMRRLIDSTRREPQQSTESSESSFQAVLQCAEGEQFGVTLGGHPSVQGLLVVDIDVSGTTAVRKWNDGNPQHPIEVGLAVLEVNGISEPRSAMFQVFRDHKCVELVLGRGLSPKQLEVLRASLELLRRRTIVEDMLQDVHGDEEPCSCAICLDDTREEEAQLPCGHRFHKACVEKWLVSEHLRCPLCNSQPMGI